jgi:hypothetical protein
MSWLQVADWETGLKFAILPAGRKPLLDAAWRNRPGGVLLTTLVAAPRRRKMWANLWIKA